MKKIIDFFVYSNAFISLIALSIFWGTCSIFHIVLSHSLLLFIGTSTWASYTLHWYFTEEKIGERNQWNQRNKKTIGILFLLNISLAGLLLLAHLNWAISVIPVIFLTLLYTAPKFPISIFKKLQGKALAKTFYLSAVWAYTTCLLPFLISNTTIRHDAIFYIITQFVFFYIICLLFDYRDQHQETVSFILIDTNKHIVKIILLLMIVPIITLYVLPNTIQIHQLSIAFLFSYWLLLFTLPKSLITKKDYWFYGLLDGCMAAPIILYQLMQMLH